MSLQVVNVFCRFNSGSTSDCDYCLMWDYISVIFREFEVMWGHSSPLWEYLCQISRSFLNIFKVRELLVLITTGTNVHVVKLHKLMHDQLMPSSSLLGVTTMVVSDASVSLVLMVKWGWQSAPTCNSMEKNFTKVNNRRSAHVCSGAEWLD